jgi:hypothetical protein
MWISPCNGKIFSCRQPHQNVVSRRFGKQLISFGATKPAAHPENGDGVCPPTRLSAGENFFEFCCRESFKTFIGKLSFSILIMQYVDFIVLWIYKFIIHKHTHRTGSVWGAVRFAVASVWVTQRGKRFLNFARFQASAAMYMTSSLFWDVTQRTVVFPYRNSGQSICPIPWNILPEEVVKDEGGVWRRVRGWLPVLLLEMSVKIAFQNTSTARTL